MAEKFSPVRLYATPSTVRENDPLVIPFHLARSIFGTPLSIAGNERFIFASKLNFESSICACVSGVLLPLVWFLKERATEPLAGIEGIMTAITAYLTEPSG